MEKVSKKLLAESQVSGIFKGLNLLDSYKEDFQEYYNEYSEKRLKDNFDSQNTEITNEDNVKFGIEGFEHLYKEFLHDLYKLIYIDVAKFSNNDNSAFSYNIEIDSILDNGEIYTHEKILKKEDIDDLNINPYDFLFKKLNILYIEHKKNYEEIFSKDGSILDLGEQVKIILRKDFSNDSLIGFLSVIDLAEFKLLDLDKFEDKSREFKDKFLDFDNKDENNESINNQDKILGYFELQISIYIDYFVNKLDIKSDIIIDEIINLNKLKLFLSINDTSDKLSSTELKLLFELINRKYDISLFYESLTKNNSLVYTGSYVKSQIKTIPDFKGISSILSGFDEVKIISSEINKILF